MKVRKEKPLSIRVTNDQYNSLEKTAEAYGVSIATIVRWAIKDYIKE